MFAFVNVVKLYVYGVFTFGYTVFMGTKAKEVSTSDKILAEYFQNSATEQGISVRTLAEKTGVSLGRVSMLLRGLRAFYVDEISAFCSALGLTTWKVLKQVEGIERALNAPAPVLDPVSAPDFTAMAAKNDGRDLREDHDQPMPDYE